MIQGSRIRSLAARDAAAGAYVLYWMQRAQRTRFNHALEYAVERANEADLPVVVGFGLTDDYPEASERHYAFMLEGLRDVARALARRNIHFVLRHGSPDRVAIELARRAALVVCDRGYLRHEKAWRAAVAADAACPVDEVETDLVVPVRTASEKRESAARTLRPKLHRLLDEYLHAIQPRRVKHDAAPRGLAAGIDIEDIDAVLGKLRIARDPGRVARFVGGETEAARRLRAFSDGKLDEYGTKRNEPAAEHTSHLSPYLHFGQISPLEIALAVRRAEASDGARAAFVEELVVRRELAFNHVEYEPHYDRYSCLPDWARATLSRHAADERPVTYKESRLAAGDTHDRYWNAAMREMVQTGYMHNTMRMYWGKKILEWSPDPEEAFRRTLRLNNRYFLDGRDPNSYANAGWIFGLHDRPWGERPIFGTVRYMNAKGLERKFDIGAYVEFATRL